MPTVLIYTSPARGHLYPIVDVALALRDAGHRVVVQTLADESGHLSAAGIAHRPIHPRIEALALTDYEGSNPIAGLRRTLEVFASRAPHEVEDLEAATSELNPDLVVVDANAFGASAHCEASGRAWAGFLPYCLPVPSRDAPAFGPGFPPPGGPLGRMRDSLVWAVQRWAGAGPLAPLQALRAGLGLAPVGSFADLFQRAPVLLYRTAEPFEYPRSDWPANVRAIGPGLWAPPGELPPWLAELPHPRVLVSVSTEFQDDGEILRAAIAGLADEPGSVLVATAALDPAGFEAPNERVRIERFLPHNALMPHLHAVVTHGGMGTTQRALAAGVPVCVVPWGRDQLESGRRVERCGGGVLLPRGSLSPARLRAAVRETLGRKEGAERVAAGFREAGGAARAVALLEELLSSAEQRVDAGVHPAAGSAV
jgi:UDP:flavonoid glycosyltransferase YjiC (YdhE family)